MKQQQIEEHFGLSIKHLIGRNVTVQLLDGVEAQGLLVGFMRCHMRCRDEELDVVVIVGDDPICKRLHPSRVIEVK